MFCRNPVTLLSVPPKSGAACASAVAGMASATVIRANARGRRPGLVCWLSPFIADLLIVVAVVQRVLRMDFSEYERRVHARGERLRSVDFGARCRMSREHQDRIQRGDPRRGVGRSS